LLDVVILGVEIVSVEKYFDLFFPLSLFCNKLNLLFGIV
jgi:hypothetical protein